MLAEVMSMYTGLSEQTLRVGVTAGLQMAISTIKLMRATDEEKLVLQRAIEAIEAEAKKEVMR